MGAWSRSILHRSPVAAALLTSAPGDFNCLCAYFLQQTIVGESQSQCGQT